MSNTSFEELVELDTTTGNRRDLSSQLTPDVVKIASSLAELSNGDESEITETIMNGFLSGVRPLRTLFITGVVSLRTLEDWVRYVGGEMEEQHPSPPHPYSDTAPPDTAIALADTNASSNGTHDSLLEISAAQMGLHYERLNEGAQEPLFEIDRPDKAVISLLQTNQLRRLELMPYRIEDSDIWVAYYDYNEGNIVELGKHLLQQNSGLKRMLLLCVSRQHFWQAFDYNLIPTLPDISNLSTSLSQGVHNYRELTKITDDDVADHAATLIQRLLLKGIHLGASDFHLEPVSGEEGGYLYQARLRVDGRLELMEDGIPQQVGKAMVQRFISVGNIRGEVATKPESGRYELDVGQAGGRFDLRLEINPIYGMGQEVVARLLGQTKSLSRLEDFYFEAETTIAEQTRQLLDEMKEGGLFLITGPTGSGKSSYLGAMLRYLYRKEQGKQKIISIENPIEARLPGVVQSQAEPGKVEFDELLRSSLRRDPDVMMIGEIRDEETLTIAIQAAATGHIVLSTLHTNSAVEAPGRLITLGARPADVAANLRGVLTQRLIPTLCENCRTFNTEGVPFAEGCETCYQTGQAGRTATGEILLINAEMRRLIERNSNADDLLKGSKMKTLSVHAAAICQAGRTTLELVSKVLGTKIGGEVVKILEASGDNETAEAV